MREEVTKVIDALGPVMRSAGIVLPPIAYEKFKLLQALIKSDEASESAEETEGE